MVESMIIFWIILFIGIFFLIIGFVDGNRFVVKKQNIRLKNLSKDCRFVLISDLHDKVYGNNNDKIMLAVDKINPDFIVLAGDLITAKEKENIMPGIDLVNKLSQKYKIYYALGNHESKVKKYDKRFGNMYSELLSSIKHPNVIMLENESCMIPEYNIMITGLELGLEYFSHFKKVPMADDYMVKTVNNVRADCCNILIAHNPDYFENYIAWGADLVLSGHVHGGIMRLPVLGGVIAPSYEIFPKYDGGIFTKDGATMLLGRGMGAHTIPLRIFNPAELYEVCLTK